MTDWAEEATRKFQQNKANNQVRETAFIERQKIKGSSGIPLWNQVRGRIKIHLSAFNRNNGGRDVLVIESDQLSEMVVRNDDADGLRLSMQFSAEMATLSWSCGSQEM